MKKIIKLAASVLTASIMLTSLIPSLVMAAEDDYVVHIEGEENCIYDENYILFSAAENEILSGGNYGYIRTIAETEFVSDDAVVSYSFDVLNDGYYELSFTASKYNNTNYSSYAVAVDDGAFVKVENGATATKTADIGTDNVFAAYKMTDSYMLLAGEHTLRFKMLDTGTRTDGRGFVFVDCADFTQVKSIPGLTIKGDDENTISDSVVSLYSEQTGEKEYPVFKTGAGVPCPDEGVIAQYIFVAPEEGLYNLTISANQYNGGLSTYAVAVNDSEFNAVNASTVTEQTQTEGAVYTYKTNINFAVNEGINTIKFKILTGRTQDQRVYCFLNYMELTKVEVAEYAIIHGADPHTSNASELGGIYADTTTEIPGALVVKTTSGSEFPVDQGVIVSYNMYVPEDGLYRMSLSASAHTSDTMSHYSVSVNEGDYKAVNASNAGPSDKPNGGMSDTSDKVLCIYDTTEIYALEKGMNTVSVKLTSPRTSDGRAYAAIEYIKFIPEEAVSAPITLYGTDTHGLTFTPSSSIGESVGERYAKNTLELYASTKEAYEAENGSLGAVYTFNASKAGTYKLTIAASEFAGKAWLSPYSVSVNGGGYTAISEENASGASSPNGGWAQGYQNVNAEASQQDVIGIYETDIKFELNEGVNTVSFKVDSLTGNGNNAIAALAWMKLEEVASEEPENHKLIFDEPSFGNESVEWEIHNNTDKAVKMSVILAVYDGGALDHCSVRDITVESGDNYTAAFSESGEELKLFAWNGIGTALPLAGAVSNK